MKNFIKSIRITIAFCILFSVCYVLILWVFGQFFGPGKGNAETITLNGKYDSYFSYLFSFVVIVSSSMIRFSIFLL